MFLSAYVVVVLLAALPLGRTILNGTGGGSQIGFLHRLYRDLAYIAVAVLGIMCLETALTISLQNYWFDELGQRYRYWLALGLRLAIFVTILVAAGIFVGYNLRALCRPLPAVPRSAPWVAAFIFSAAVAFAATTLWIPLLGFLGATAGGTADPVFGRDVSFYLLALPWYDAAVGIVITVLVITFALWALIGLTFYPRSGSPWDRLAYRVELNNTQPLRLIDAADAYSRPQREMVWERWLRQGLMLAMLLCLSSGASRFLGRYHLVIDGHSPKSRHSHASSWHSCCPTIARSNGRRTSRMPRTSWLAHPFGRTVHLPMARRISTDSIARAPCSRKCGGNMRRAITANTANFSSSSKNS